MSQIVYPSEFKTRIKLDSKLGIKSALDNLRSVVSTVYLLYVANDKHSSFQYSEEYNDNGVTKIRFRQTVIEHFSKYLNKDISSLKAVLSQNKLITTQYEPLYVGISLFFKLANLVKMSSGTERTGGTRLNKKLEFATNTLLLDIIIESFELTIRQDCLWKWLNNEESGNVEFEEKLKRFLMISAQQTQMKARMSSSDDIVFQMCGIYEQINQGNIVNIKGEEEIVGPNRVLSSFLDEGLDVYISKQSGSNYALRAGVDGLEDYYNIIETTLDINNVEYKQGKVVHSTSQTTRRIDNDYSSISSYLTAIRTKPFLLLAGISGTGKSRIVRELAFKSCPKYLQDKDGTTPGNYCMIEVKPNWHDSTELLGYYSNLSKGYQFKKFVKFLIKAKMFPKVPFFVCLDEMNLAPVEQYFAEILSILETRKVVTGEDGNRSVKTGAIIDSEYFKNLGKIGGFAQNFTDRDIYMKLHDIDTESIIADEVGKRTDLTTEGLTLPDNVIIIGTVNMDDTTHQFSRKVIDRAMTIEMNGGKLKNMFGGSNNLTYLEEEEQKKWQAAFKQEYVSADEVLVAHPNEANDIVQLLPEKLDAINAALKGTPFEVSYRVLNELTIMAGVMLDDTPDEEFEKIVDNALDRILLMKILPRIEGDSDMFNLKTTQTVGGVTCRNRLEWLRELAPNINYSEEDGKDHQQTAKEKIEEMIERLENQEFTRFWP